MWTVQGYHMFSIKDQDCVFLSEYHKSEISPSLCVQNAIVYEYVSALAGLVVWAQITN